MACCGRIERGAGTRSVIGDIPLVAEEARWTKLVFIQL
jgi:hypothetical protein